MVRSVLVAAAMLAMLSAAGAQERGRHGGAGMLSGMLPAPGPAVGNGDSNPTRISPPLDSRGAFDQAGRHCFGQDRQGRRVRVPC